MGSSMFSILILVLLFAVMYFLMIRPQKKREKETKAMRASLAVGDEIVTIGGLCCKVVYQHFNERAYKLSAQYRSGKSCRLQ